MNVMAKDERTPRVETDIVLMGQINQPFNSFFESNVRKAPAGFQVFNMISNWFQDIGKIG